MKKKIRLATTAVVAAGSLLAASLIFADEPKDSNANDRQLLRKQYEQKRDHLSGADRVSQESQTNQNSFVDTPMDTHDAPDQRDAKQSR